MYNSFIKYIKANHLFDERNRVLLAVSGGLDSVVLATLFKQSAYPFGIVHCNFQLRGKDSDQDESFVKFLAEEMQTACFSKKFDTIQYAKQHKISVQMAARALRYAYFEEVRVREGYDFIATAHHCDDSIETLIINMLRGTGISGLKGIPRKINKIIRPLLFASREHIEAFATSNRLTYREDRSNKNNIYLRNKIRHQLLPVFKELNPSFNKSMQVFFDRMEATDAIFTETINRYKHSCLIFTDNEIQIVVEQLLRLPHARVVLYEFLKEFGFSARQADEVFEGIGGQPGKIFTSESHKLIRDRNLLIIVALQGSKQKTHKYCIDHDTFSVSYNSRKIIFEHGVMSHNGIILPNNAKTLMADYEKLSFPLTLRPWQHGDTIIQLGMKGRKKISDILIDEKIPLHKKNNIMVLCSGGEIIWIVGLRIAEEIKITKKTKKFFQARML